MDSFEQQMLAHLCRLIEWDRDYAEKQIPWYFKTCPWLEPLIGPALRQKWAESSASSSPETLSARGGPESLPEAASPPSTRPRKPPATKAS